MSKIASHRTPILIRPPLLLSIALAAGMAAVAGMPAAAGAGTDAPAPASAETTGGLAPGDSVELRFWQEPALNGEYAVDERGIAVLPLLGEYRVTGIDLDALRRQILERYYHELTNREVRVTPLRRISILGSVRNPGLYHIDGTMKVTDALALAGGQTADGKRDEVLLLRDAHEIKLALDKSLPGAGLFRSGDQLFVPQRSWVARNSVYLVTGFISSAAIIYAATL
jgi:protein involved in polysaccharide export with SLBB domain